MFLIYIFNVRYFSSTESISLFVLITGLVVTISTFYVIYNVTSDVDSILDKKRKNINEELQKKKIARLYPQSK